MPYQAFISYKHGAEARVAAGLELALKRYARSPFSRPPKVFRDETHLVPEGDLPALIRSALLASEYLILLASPESARSPWVRDELTIWCGERKATGRLIVVRAITGISLRIGALALRRGDARPAALHYRSGLHVLARLAASPAARPQWLDDLATAHDRLAEVEDPTGHLSASLAIREELADDHPDDARFAFSISKSEQELSAGLRRTDPSRARSLADAAVARLEALVREDGATEELLDSLAVAHLRLGEAMAATGAPPRPQFERTVEVVRRARALRPDSPRWLDIEAVALDRLAELDLERDPARAGESVARALRLREEALHHALDDVARRRRLAVAHYNLRRVARRQGEVDRAHARIAEALALVHGLSAESPPAVEWLDEEIDYLAALANLEVARGRPVAARGWLRQIIAARSRICSGDLAPPLPSAAKREAERAATVRAYLALARLELWARRPPQARDALAAARELAGVAGLAGDDARLGAELELALGPP